MHHSTSLILRIAPLFCGTFLSPSFAAWKHFDPADTSQIPKVFSNTGFYTDWGKKTVTAEAIPFDVNSPLWSDNAAKSRWILLKPGSAKVQFDPAQDYYDYPDGAVFIKQFQHDTIAGSPASRIYWETRLLVNKKVSDTLPTTPPKVVVHDKWYPFTYKWNPNGSEAYLVRKGGLDTSLTVSVNGKKTFRKWRFPSVGDCNFCHREYNIDENAQGRSILGFFTPQLNRATAADTGFNQIRKLFQGNILGWSKAAPTETEIKAMPKWARPEDETAALELRARAYIAANCSGCHGARGNATKAADHAVELNYDYFTQEGNKLKPAMELLNKQVSTQGLQPIVNTKGDSVYPALIVPGYPELSVLLYRMKSRNRSAPGEDTAFANVVTQMPPLSVFEEDTIANNVVARWIKSLPATSIRGIHAGFGGRMPIRRGDRVTLPPGSTGHVRLTALDGRMYALTGLSGMSYRLPPGLSPGIYFLRSGKQVFKLML